MGTKFGGHFPAVMRGSRRDHLMFVLAAGMAFSLLIILLVVSSSKSVEATRDHAQDPVVAQPIAVGTVTLLAFSKNVRMGERIPASAVKEIYWPRNEVPDGAVLDPAELSGKFAKVNISPEVPVKRSQLSDQKIIETLPITPGMRAVTIEVDAESGLEGWTLPGTKVDVALTHIVDNNLTTQVIVQNARVLSQSGSAELAPERPNMQRKQVKAGSTVTLEASPADALKIQTAKKLGSLSLLGRDVSDEKATSTTSVNAPAIVGEKAPKDKSKRTCNRGSMRIGGQEYMIDCDGSITEVRPDE